MSIELNLPGQYASVNGLNLYYELHGSGFPLVLLHGGGSTIQSNYAHILPVLAKGHLVIAVELQAHGHTPDRDIPLSFEQDADDVAALLNHLKIEKANVLGFSNGGTTTLQLAIRHPHLVHKIVLASATYKRDGMDPGLFEGLHHATIDHMPHLLKEAYFEANPDQEGFQKMFFRDVTRMINFKDISDTDIAGIQAPALVINGDKDVVTTEHALALSRTLPHARQLVLPSGHGGYLGEVCSIDKTSNLAGLTLGVIIDFLKGSNS